MAAVKPRAYPAKGAAGNRKQEALPGTLEVLVTNDADGFHASARKKVASGHSSSWAVRRLAGLLGYSKHADVVYIGPRDGQMVFRIVEVMPCTQ
ncbi:hypothetical protein [Thermomonas sp.]|uniref:hypothetical protein n=1 Tax=Thermomonas sp. TaxID=1971895 RepID=UPI0035B43841